MIYMANVTFLRTRLSNVNAIKLRLVEGLVRVALYRSFNERGSTQRLGTNPSCTEPGETQRFPMAVRTVSEKPALARLPLQQTQRAPISSSESLPCQTPDSCQPRLVRLYLFHPTEEISSAPILWPTAPRLASFWSSVKMASPSPKLSGRF